MAQANDSNNIPDAGSESGKVHAGQELGCRPDDAHVEYVPAIMGSGDAVNGRLTHFFSFLRMYFCWENSVLFLNVALLSISFDTMAYECTVMYTACKSVCSGRSRHWAHLAVAALGLEIGNVVLIQRLIAGIVQQQPVICTNLYVRQGQECVDLRWQ